MTKISKFQLERYPIYLKYFKELLNEGTLNVSAKTIGKKLGFSQEQVRKDLATISSVSGKPKAGRRVDQTIKDIELFLGYEKDKKAVVMGVGRLGGALMDYPYFDSMGFHIVAGFDKNPAKIGSEVRGSKIYSCDDFTKLANEIKPDIAIISVPAEQAQRVANLAIEHGVRGIWNFAPVKLDIPEEIAIENVNLSSSLAKLTHELK